MSHFYRGRATAIVAVYALTCFADFGFALGPPARYVLTDIGTLGGSLSFATAINESGQIAGKSNDRAFCFDGMLHGLGTFGGSLSEAGDINDQGVLTGYSTTRDLSGARAFIFDGTMQDIGTLSGGTYAYGQEISADGWVTGWSGGRDHAFLYDGVVMHDLGTLGGSESRGYGINNSHQVTGRSSIAGSSSNHAFMYDGVAMHDLGTLGGARSEGHSINAAGHVAGMAQIAGKADFHAFLYDGVMHDLGTLGGDYSFAHAINSFDAVVGWSYTNNAMHAFFYTRDLGMVDLNSMVDVPSGWVLEEAFGINDVGQIVGSARVGANSYRPFLITPVPEPSSIFHIAYASLSLIWWKRCSRGTNQRRPPKTIVRQCPGASACS